VRDRTVVFTTTNGTRALLAVQGAPRIAVAGFVNAAAVVRWLGAGPGGVLLLCAGDSGRFCLEDATCAGLLVEGVGRLRPETPRSDAARAAAILYAHYAPDLAAMLDQAVWAQALVAQGRGGDLALCARVDAYDVVPVLRDGTLVAEGRR
jgi:2-phosphosulfolactate phosphatase